jgi:hypothetical protein
MSDQEMNEALDALEDEHGEFHDLDNDLDNADNDGTLNGDKEELDGKPAEKPPEKPPGFKTYEEWVAEGKDPADFRGENAYKKQYDALKEVRELKDAMTHVVDGMQTWKQQQSDVMAQQVEQARTNAVAELEQAKEDDDLDAALVAQNKINDIDSKPAATQVNPVISTFASKNPIIDPNNAQYDAEFHQDMIMIHNGKLDQLLGGDRSRAGELTESQIERVQNLAFKQAKELHGDKFVSPKNGRRTPASPAQRPTKPGGTPVSRLSQVKGNTKNPRDTSAANDIYEILKAKDPKAAETFAKNVLGEQ